MRPSSKVLKKLVIFSVLLNLLLLFSFWLQTCPYTLRGRNEHVYFSYFILIVFAEVVSLVSAIALFFIKTSRLNKFLYAAIHLSTFALLIYMANPLGLYLSFIFNTPPTYYVEYVSPTGKKSIVYEEPVDLLESPKLIKGYTNILIFHQPLQIRQSGPTICESLKNARVMWNSCENQMKWEVSTSGGLQRCTIEFD